MYKERFAIMHPFYNITNIMSPNLANKASILAKNNRPTISPPKLPMPYLHSFQYVHHHSNEVLQLRRGDVENAFRPALAHDDET